MTRAYVLDAVTRDVVGLVDQSWEKLKYTRRYWGMDTFEMSIQRARLYASTLETGRLLYLPDEGDRIFLIEQINSVAEGSSANDLMTVAGRSLEGIAMAERIVIPPAGQDYDKVTATPGETAMKHYVTDHASSTATDVNRRVPSLVCIASAATGANVTVAGRYQYVFDLVKQIGLLTGQGWEILYNPTLDRFEFDVINGVDRHASVFFDFAFETLEKWEELDSIADSKTVAVVAGQGEGKDRDIRTRGSGTGFDRREAFIDARDIDLGATTELDARGDAFLAAASKETRLEAGIHQYGSFKYGIHWDMGDLVLVRNAERGISYTARVVEVEKAFDRSSAAPTVTAIIDRPFPTLKEQVSGAGAGAGAVDYPDTLNPKVDSIILDRLNQDVNLYRGGANILKTDDEVVALIGLTGERASAALGALRARVTADTVDRLTIQADGKMLWSTGAAGADTSLYRAGASQLKTDGELVATGFLTVEPAAGATNEGGELILNGAAAFNDWHFDNLDGRLRWFVGGNVYMDLSTTALGVAGSVNVGNPTGGTGISLGTGGDIELSASTNPFIDFKANPAHDFDARLIFNLSGNGLMEYYQGGTPAPFKFNSDVLMTGLFKPDKAWGFKRTGAASATSPLPFATVVQDSHSAQYNSTNKTWTIPTGGDGIWLIVASLVGTVTGAPSGGRGNILVNGVAVSTYFDDSQGSTNVGATTSALLPLAAGDTISVAYSQIGGTSPTFSKTLTLSAMRLFAAQFAA